MRRHRFEAALGALLVSAALAAPASAQATRVVVNGREVDFPDQQPVQRAGRVYVPLRGVLNRIGAETVEWRPAREEVFVASGSREILLQIDNNRARVDGQSVFLDAPPILIGGRTLVPLRFVSENLGASVQWDDPSRTAYITAAVDRVAGRRETYPPAERDDPPLPPRREPQRQPPPEDELAPFIRPHRPLPGERISDLRPEITVLLGDRQANDVNYDSVRMWVNGDEVTRELEFGINSVIYRPRSDLPPGPVRIRVTARDRDGTVFTRDWSFRTR